MKNGLNGLRQLVSSKKNAGKKAKERSCTKDTRIDNGGEKMYLEAEVYGLLNWGFIVVMLLELISIVGLWLKHKFSKEAFIWFVGHIIFFAFAGYKLLEAINITEHKNFMGSENSSLSIGFSGVLWAISTVCLMIGLSRLLSFKTQVRDS